MTDQISRDSLNNERPFLPFYSGRKCLWGPIQMPALFLQYSQMELAMFCILYKWSKTIIYVIFALIIYTVTYSVSRGIFNIVLNTSSYPSGRIAITISSVGAGDFTYTVLEDNPSHPNIQAIFTSTGHSTCYHPNGLIWYGCILIWLCYILNACLFFVTCTPIWCHFMIPLQCIVN